MNTNRSLFLFALAVVGFGMWMFLGESRTVVPDNSAPIEYEGAEAPVLLTATGSGNAAREPDPATNATEPKPEWARNRARIDGAKYRIAVTLLGVSIADRVAVEGWVSTPSENRMHQKGYFDGEDAVWFVLHKPLDDPQTMLLIELSALGVLPSKTHVQWSQLAHRQDAEGRHTWRTSVVLSEGVVQRGLVTDAAGLPIDYAWIEGYAVHEGPIPRKPYVSTRSDARGQFELRLRPHTDTLLVASEDRFAPTSIRVEGASPSTPLPQITLSLAAGHSVEGRVLWQGAQPPEHQGAWEVWFELPDADTATFGGRVGWRLDAQGMVQRAWGTVEAGADGTFVIHGLAATKLEVWADGCRNEKYPIDTAIMDAAHVVVRPPVRGIVMDLRPAWIRLEIRTEDQQTPARFSIGMESEQSGWWRRFPTWANPALAVAPATEYTLRVGADGYTDQGRSVTSPPAGETTVARFELERATKSATLTLMFGEPVPHITAFRLQPADAVSPDASAHEIVSPEHGAFSMQVPVGRWRLRCHPGRTNGSRPRHWKLVDQVIDIPSAGTVVRVPVEQGGLLRVDAIDSEGSPLAARVEVLNRRDEVASVTWLKPHHDRWDPDYEPTLGPAGVGWAREPLDPGPYTVHVRMAGYEMWEGAIDVERGKTAAIRAQLKRKP